ncbi:hypothetical protein FA95DRAFT_1574831 [Auriscalpium vulgare]|uniref:Uncharacterized protein n=1 Tax=Auriscalpium vulgare TaxID=40419 RepID=A0ACB8RIN5_9AGAM|nr:hypothetical protein FA95DRAFT_1574831 [Auriscalpium vulgare]
MDFQFTSRPNADLTPAWKADSPQKRPHTDLTPPSTPSSFPSFRTTPAAPFIFHAGAPPPPGTPHAHAWAPPDAFSPATIFPAPAPELRDVDMGEASPLQAEAERPVALGAMRRVYKARVGRRVRRRRREEEEDASEESEGSASEDGDAAGAVGRRSASPRKARVQKTSHHYTLNMPSPSAGRTDTPYMLLGYLQFFFNLSLILLFLYLVVQFILTVQRDVEERVTEYSMEIVQEIANCAVEYKANLCGGSPVPAMVRQCGAWETCMNRDPTIVGRAKVGAELIAEVVNGFVEPISWKTLAFTLSSLAFLTIFINTLLSLYRTRLQPAAAPPPPPAHAPPFALPHAPGPYVESAGWSAPAWDASGAPSRRRRLEGGLAAKIQ